jgi:hypothetical protein
MVATAMLAASVSAEAQKTDKACLYPEEIDAMVISFAPRLIEVTATACKPHLAENAYLNRSSGVLAERYRVAGKSLWPLAYKGMLKMSGLEKVKNPLIKPDALREMLDAKIPEIVADIKPETCVTIDRVGQLVDPLPPQNMAGLFSTILEIVSADERKKGETGGGKSKGWGHELNVCAATDQPG